MKTDITVVLDRSGSMASIADDVIGGFNTFVTAQQQEPGEARLTLVQFDDQYEVVHFNVPIGDVPPLTHRTFVPRGSTALLDAIGRTIISTATRLEALPAADRPGAVIVAIQTDGQENASREFRRKQIFDMIRHQERVFRWQFLFLAANQDAIVEGEALGISAGQALDFAPTGSSVRAMYSVMSAKIGRVRQGLDERLAFDDSDRRSAGGKKK